MEGGYEDRVISTEDLRYCSVHEETNDGYKRVWPTDVKCNLLC